MALTQNALRKDGCRKRIEKLNQKIDRLNNLIQKKQAKIASGKEEANKWPDGSYFLQSEIEWHQEDIKRAEKDLIVEKKKFAEYVEKVEAEEKRDASIPHVESVEIFLQEWKNRNLEYFRTEVKRLDEFEQANKGLPYRERQKLIANEFLVTTIFYSQFSNSEFEERLENDLNREVIALRIDLFRRCTEAVGLITDASKIDIGMDGSLNGFVIGEEGRASVETIGAGGYNIQRYHYRVLIKKVK